MDREKEWSRKQIIELLNALKKYPCIWDMSSEDHKNKQKKCQSYLELAYTFECSKDDIERKIAVLRAGYRRELKKEMAAKAAGLDSYETRWFYYKHMAFLHPDNCKFNLKRNPDEEEDDSCEASQIIDYEIQSSDEVDTPLIPPCSDKTKRKKKRTATGSVKAYDREFFNETTNLLKVITDINLQRTQACKDEWDLFGASIASQLSNLKNNYAKSSAKLNIQKAIFEAEQLDMNMSSLPTYTMANLNNHTRISESPPALIPTIPPNVYNSKTTPPSGFKNVTPSSELGGTTAMPVLNKKTTPLIIYPTGATSPGNAPTSSSQAQHFLICTKTKNVVK